MNRYEGHPDNPGAGFGRQWRGAVPIVPLVLISMASAAEPIALSDQGLSTITAGGLSSPVEAVASPSSTEPDEGKLPDAKRRAGVVHDPVAIIVVADTVSITKSLHEIFLTGHSQASLRAANLVNAAAADSASGLNVLDQRRGSAEGGGVSRVEQLNIIVQARVRDAAGLDHFAATGAGTERSEQQSRVETRARNATLTKEAKNIRHSLKETRSTIATSVEGKKIFPDGVTILDPTISAPDFTVPLPTFAFDGIKKGILDGIIRDKDGAKSDEVSGKRITFSGAGLSIGGITLKGDDIVIGPTTLTVPGFSLGEVTVGTVVCRIFLCPNKSFTIGAVTINDDTLELFGERVIEGANPIPGIVGYGGGYAFVGTGTIESEKKGKATLQGALGIDLGEFGPGQIIDFTIPWRNIRDSDGDELDDGLNVGKQLTIAATTKLPEITWEVDLELDLEFPAGFTGTFDGAVCVSSEVCGTLEISKTKFVMIDDGVKEVGNVDETHTKSHSSMETFRKTSPVEVHEAEADVLVLSAASADAASYSIVIVDGGAQSEMRALNAVNGARAIVGNGLNVVAARSGNRDASGRINRNLSQVNTFVQIGGL